MAASPYNLRGRLNAQGLTLKNTSTGSPLAKQSPRSPLKSNAPISLLNLRTVIGTTTEAQTGFACHPDSDTFAFCGGSAVVLGRVNEAGQVSQRFFRAHPTTGAVNPVFSYYDETPAYSTPENRRKSVLPARSGGFSVGSTGSPRRDLNEETISKPWTAKDRVKATSSVSLTTDGRFLAVGETGYCPRVLVFSTEDDSNVGLPLAIIMEHSFGVRAVAFSQDSKYLATLGDANDGFLFIWSFDTRTGAVKLHSTNKCTTNICGMAWCGESLVTVGTRHVKVWQIPERPRKSPTKSRGRRLEGEKLASPSPQALLGRNCLLGSLADATFTCVTAISNNEAVVCTDRGQACVIGGAANTQEIKVSKQFHFGIYAVTANLTTGKVLFGGLGGALEREDAETLRCLARPTRRSSSGQLLMTAGSTSPKIISPCSSPPRTMNRRHHRVTALGWLSKSIVSIDNKSKLKVLLNDDKENLTTISTVEAHHEPVQGLCVLQGKCDLGTFLTWSPNGTLNFWDTGGKLQYSKFLKFESTQSEFDGVQNELKIVQVCGGTEYVVCGDKLGLLKIIKIKDWAVLHDMRAHGAEITDIAVYDDSQTSLIATCGRDRIVQLFALRNGAVKSAASADAVDSSHEAVPISLDLENSSGSLELLQTMDDHVGAVGHVIFTSRGERLLSCSADRTVFVRDRVTRSSGTATTIAYICSRIVTLKSSPIAMAAVVGDEDSLVVSTIDRQVLRLNMSSGTQTESFRVNDGEGDENAVMNFVQISKDGSSRWPRLLVGSCSTDKSIRVYDYDQCILIARESAHTEGISGLAFIEEQDSDTSMIKRTVISTGLDGTIMIWDLKLPSLQPSLTHRSESFEGQALQSHEPNGVPSRTPTALCPPLRKVLSKTDLADFSYFDPVTKSLTPVRDQSPPRIRRRTSRFSLAPNKLGLSDSPFLPPLKQSPVEGAQSGHVDPVRNRSPSPTPLPEANQHIAQKSLMSDTEQNLQRQNGSEVTCTPVSPLQMPMSMPSTPSSKPTQRANNARLRRPPSIPSDLHGKSNVSHGRRKSLTPTTTPAAAAAATTTATMLDSSTTEAASASQSLSRSLRGYRKTIGATASEQATEEFQLAEIETELLATLQTVREAKRAQANARTRATGGNGRRAKANANASVVANATATATTESELDSLAELMERTGV